MGFTNRDNMPENKGSEEERLEKMLGAVPSKTAVTNAAEDASVGNLEKDIFDLYRRASVAKGNAVVKESGAGDGDTGVRSEKADEHIAHDETGFSSNNILDVNSGNVTDQLSGAVLAASDSQTVPDYSFDNEDIEDPQPRKIRKPKRRRKQLSRMSFEELHVERERLSAEFKERIDRIDELISEKENSMKEMYMEGLIQNYIATHGGSGIVSYAQALRALTNGETA